MITEGRTEGDTGKRVPSRIRKHELILRGHVMVQPVS